MLPPNHWDREGSRSFVPGIRGEYADLRRREERHMGINRWSDVEQRKRNETEAKAGDEIPKNEKGDAFSRL